MASHKFLVLDTSTPGLFECWRKLKYTRERFGLGSFSLVVPVDHAQASTLARNKRVLIVRDADSSQEARLWGVITGLHQRYEAGAGPDLGETGKGQVYYTVRGLTYAEFLLGGRVYPVDVPQVLAPDWPTQEYNYGVWTGDYLDVDDSPDSHDSDSTYMRTATNYSRESFFLAAHVSEGAIAGIKLRSVWRNEEAGSNEAFIALRIYGNNQLFCLPTGDGSYTGWVAGGDHFDDVDDPVGSSDGDSSYITSDTVGARDSFFKANISLASLAEPREIIGISVVIVAKKTGGTGSLRAFLRLDGVDYDGDDLAMTTSYLSSTTFWWVNPATNQPWTVGEVSDVQFGVKNHDISGGDYNRVTQIYLVVDYAFVYYLGTVQSTSYAEFSKIVELNPATLLPWTDDDLAESEVGLYVRNLSGPVRVTSLAVEVFHGAITTTDHLDDVMKDWAAACLVSGVASADRAVSGFAVEADEHAGASGSYDIAHNLLLQRLMALGKLHGVGFDVVGAWASGATKLNAAAVYTFSTCVPEGVDRTHDQAVVADVIISRERGLVRTLSYEVDGQNERNAVTALG
ncbi:MAG: hypothetical protein FJ014_19665, partial [Chloroflexi bacterium]|nr:hypothetical protein [Chloroflexota bacterium]